MRLERREGRGESQVSGHLDARPEVVVGLRQKGRDDVTEYITLASFPSTEFRSTSFPFISNTLPPLDEWLYSRRAKSFRDWKFRMIVFWRYMLVSQALLIIGILKCETVIAPSVYYRFWLICRSVEWKIYIKNSFLFVISLEEQFLLDYEATPSFHFPRDKREECTKSSHLGETADKFLLSILGSRDRSLPVKQFAGNEAAISWTNGSYHFFIFNGIKFWRWRGRGRGNNSINSNK